MAAKAQHQTHKQQKQSNKSTIDLTIKCSFILSAYRPYRVNARLGVRKIGKHSARHIAGRSKFCRELQFALSNQHFYICQSRVDIP